MSGLIAFFDILGYQSFLENNSASESALKVLDLITDIPKLAKDEFANQWKQHEAGRGEVAEQVAKSFNHLIFSDSILLSIEYPTNADNNWKYTALGYLALFSAKLFGYMFARGLPMRGAIVEGSFVIKDTCFAGKAIVDGYRLCESLDFSGIVFDKALDERLPIVFQGKGFERYFVSYLSPLNNGSTEKKYFHINWIGYWPQEFQKAIRADIDTFVLRSFWSHRKDCSLAVDPKINNTAKLIRRLSIALDEPM